MQYPTKVRTNMRYRGPVESYKMSRDNNEILSDLTRISKIMDTNGEGVAKLESLGMQEMVLEDSDSVTFSKLDRRIEVLKRGIKHV